MTADVRTISGTDLIAARARNIGEFSVEWNRWREEGDRLCHRYETSSPTSAKSAGVQAADGRPRQSRSTRRGAHPHVNEAPLMELEP